MSYRILLVDDDVSFVDIISGYLTSEGYHIDYCHDGETAITKVEQANYDVILLDIMLPTISGLHVLKVLKPQMNTPIILLTARGGAIDEILGLDTGAFDYISKPFDLKVLSARLRSAINSSQKNTPAIETDILSFKTLVIFQKERKAVLNGIELALTKSEYLILTELIKNIFVSLSKEYLHSLLSNKPMTNYDRSIDTHIKNLRKKIKLADKDYKFSINTIYGYGYTLKYNEN